MMRRLVASAIACGTVLVSSVALACPVCASREEPGSLRYAAIGAMILLPWAVAASIGLWIRRGVRHGDAGGAAAAFAPIAGSLTDGAPDDDFDGASED